MKLIFKEKILFMNIFVSFIIYFLIVLSQKYTCVIFHGYNYPWQDYSIGRFPAFCYEFLFNNFLPNLFNMSPNDFRSGGGLGCILISLVSFSICFLFARFFFLNVQKLKDIFKRKEYILVISLSFLFIFSPIIGLKFYDYLFRIEDLGVSSEYFLNLVLLLSFLSLFFLDIKNKDTHNNDKKYYMTIVIISFMTGAYNELTNLMAFFDVLLMLLFLFFFDKEKLYNKNILFFVVPLILGMIHYFFICNNFLNIVSKFYGVDVQNAISNSVCIVGSFLDKYIHMMFKSKSLYLLIISVLFLIILRKKDKTYNFSAFFALSFLFAYWIVNIFTIFVSEIYGNFFMFERYFQDNFYINMLELSILIQLGIIYDFLNKKYIINVFLILIILVFSILFIDFWKEVQKEKFSIKSFLYNLDKQCLVYSYFGETVLLPESYRKIFEKCYERIPLIVPKTEMFQGKYYMVNSDYMNYFSGIYKNNFDGLMFVDDKVAKVELSKRVNLLDDTEDDMNIIYGDYISFKDIYDKYKNKKITTKDVLRLQDKKGKHPILIKTLAYTYYKEKNYKKAIELYKEYLLENPNDFDANYNISTMYKDMGNFEDASYYMMKLNYAEDEELSNLYKLLKLYYYDIKDKHKCLEICNKIIGLNKNNADYINKAIIYAYFGDIDLAIKTIEEASREDKDILNQWMEVVRTDLTFPKSTKLVVP